MFLGNTLLGSSDLAILAKLLLAALAGALVGMEREKHGRPAGLRTNMLVGVGACTMMIISEAFYLKYGAVAGDSVLRIDPARTAAQIITGIGFLGAGVILKDGSTVRGLTTAATLWVVAGLGMSFGMGFLSLGVLSTILVLFGLIFMRKVDVLIKKDRYLPVCITGFRRASLYDDIHKALDDLGMVVIESSSRVDIVEDEAFFRMVLGKRGKRSEGEILAAIEEIKGIKKIQIG